MSSEKALNHIFRVNKIAPGSSTMKFLKSVSKQLPMITNVPHRMMRFPFNSAIAIGDTIPNLQLWRRTDASSRQDRVTDTKFDSLMLLTRWDLNRMRYIFQTVFSDAFLQLTFKVRGPSYLGLTRSISALFIMFLQSGISRVSRF